MITFADIAKIYNGREVLSGINFEIGPGEFVCLTGPSGAGKSSLVHLLIRAETPTSGQILIDGADLNTLPVSVLQLYRRRTGVVFQDYRLLADRTVKENVAFVLEVSGETDSAIEERVHAVLQRLQMEERQDSFPRELSGGEKTRAALARALVHNPSILIADEPTGNIDPEQSLQILRILKEINAEGTTVLLASHDKTVVDTLNVRVIRLEGGKIKRDAPGGYETVSAPPGAAVTKPQGEVAENAEVSEEHHPIKHVRTSHHNRGESKDGPHAKGSLKPIGI